MRMQLAVLVLLLPSAARAQTSPGAVGASGSFFALSVGDLEASTRWYTEKLGLHVVMRAPAANGVAVTVLEADGLLVELVHNDNARGLNSTGTRSEPSLTHGYFKVGFLVGDLDATLALLRSRGVRVAVGPYPATATQRANAIIEDNAGNLIQLFGRRTGER